MQGFDFRRRILLGVVAAALVGFPAHAQDAGRARGLVITAGYADRGDLRLANTGNDGSLIAARMQQLRFKSVDRIIDPDAASLQKRLSAFIGKLGRSDVALVYVAGHGVQISGHNYLLMNDGDTLVDIAPIVAALRRASGAVVVLLDACRNNPLEDARTTGRALRMNRDVLVRPTNALTFTSLQLGDVETHRMGEIELGGTGVMVVYATDPRNVAADSVAPGDRNSPFATAIAQRLSEQRLFASIVGSVVEDVVAATGGEQAPWSSGSIRDIYFAGRPSSTAPRGIPG